MPPRHHNDEHRCVRGHPDSVDPPGRRAHHTSVIQVAAGTHLILEVPGTDTVNHDLLIAGAAQTLDLTLPEAGH